MHVNERRIQVVICELRSRAAASRQYGDVFASAADHLRNLLDEIKRLRQKNVDLRNEIDEYREQFEEAP